MQRRQRRGRRPLDTILVSERRVGGVREFVFFPADAPPGERARPGRPLRALMTARAFSWADDPPVANDPSFGGGPEETAKVRAQERDFEDFLRALGRVYRAPRRGS